jgi:prepilin-type N-terminal cleavage/methylation domain-containing protein
MRKGFTLVELLIAIIIIGLLGTGLTSCYFGIGNSDGERVGHVVKFANKGIMTKSWEGELNVGVVGLTTTKNQSGKYSDGVWHFSVTNPEIVIQVRDAMRANKRVALGYHESIMYPPWKQDTAYEIVSVTVID